MRPKTKDTDAEIIDSSLDHSYTLPSVQKRLPKDKDRPSHIWAALYTAKEEAVRKLLPDQSTVTAYTLANVMREAIEAFTTNLRKAGLLYEG